MTAWDDNRAALRDHFKYDKLEDFLQWSTVRKTMYVGNVWYIDKEHEALKPEWKRWMEVVRWTGFGADAFHSGTGYASCTNLIHQLYHLKQWLDRSPKTVDQLKSIIEVGAGYGAMALICHRLGFEGRYYIVDLPELEQIQAYYLGQTIPEARSHIHWLQSALSPKLCDLFIALHSLGEMPVSEREKILSQVKADAYLFASSYEFEGVDNQTWFREFAEGKPGYGWEQWAHPHQENAFYQVGVRL